MSTLCLILQSRQCGSVTQRLQPARRRCVRSSTIYSNKSNPHMALPIAFRSATQLASALRRGRIGSLELLNLYLSRIERYNPKLNAIIAMDLDAARKRARQADAALKKGVVWGSLHGLPMTIKESFDVVPLPTTWGLPEYKNNRAQRNALAVQRYIDAGAIVFGKTNVPTLL